ncbi:hypothetical protein IAU60_003542 [Kwoniella sp. DSM 27419]
MTLYYSICFGLLMSELALFGTIVCPMPFTLRKRLFHFLSENPIVAKIQYGLKITFIFVAVLFIDALQRMVRIAQEGAAAKAKPDVTDVRTETNYAARRFYAQRNCELTTSSAKLTFSESYTALQTKVAKQSGASGENEELRKRINELESELKVGQSKDRDFETLKKQASQQNAEYNRLADEHNRTTGSVSDKKAD